MDADLDRLIQLARDGDESAAAQLATSLYGEFRRLARRFLRGERADHTLQPTALANEVYLRLFAAPFPQVGSRGEFFVAVARTIRRILIEHARRKGSRKRGGGWERVPLDEEALPGVTGDDGRLLELDAALERLAEVDPDKARLVELRFFGGLSVAEAAKLLGTSERTAARDWRVARAFLEGELRAPEKSSDDVDGGALAKD